MATDITVTNTIGAHQKSALTATQVNYRLKVADSAAAKVQVFCNVAWYYSSADAGSTADDWAQMGAGQYVELPVDGAGITSYTRTKSFWARTASGSANIHFVEVG